jgi:outer membrane receptor protein involved in Fe transport
MRSVVKRWPVLKGSRLTLSVTNLFDQRLRVRDGAGVTPLNFQPDYLDPTGRVVALSVRKLFF